MAIRGAQPGMTLEVQINEIRPGVWGWTYTDGWDRLNAGEMDHVMNWTLDMNTMTGRDQYYRIVKLRPFMGVMGMPPDEAGTHDTGPPRYCGGNLDCKELIEGSTLYLPIPVPGALFSVGDGHALQGDGEVCGTAIECPMERVSLTFRVRDDLHISGPRANTPAGWPTIALHEDLDEALVMALKAMLDHMQEQ